MNQTQAANRFEEHRPHLRGVAYRMLGSASEADDAVQDAWLRYSQADTGDVANLRGWLTTVVARICLNRLRTRRQRPEGSLDANLPEPMVSPPNALDPSRRPCLATRLGWRC